ncbi:unnamed protein product [Dracunculus medinensis]|uniref:AA_permease_C domain-containing protein n=1 Tax=Dracunculus medinensis TaxID=318479 RepID=A0A0N4UFE5_DRAME|nr:unnamed protein product [Dracunculus medinensis]
MENLWRKLFRLKSNTSDCLDTRLRRCLSIVDITLLGVGHMIGAGIYVLTGSVVHNNAGPSIVISFALAGIASLLSALCYAEFGARYPKAGSAYTYAYIGVGELWAFIIGWNIILEHMLGAAAVARSWSGYFNSLFASSSANFSIINIGHFDESLFADYPDLIAFVAVVAVAIFTGFGSKASTNFNSVFTIINMMVIVFIVSYGFTFADTSLWSGLDEETGTSKFMPFGVNGMLAGAASCFFAYIGFDGLATAGEEASDPSRTIPLATFISMSIVTTAYICMSAALTLMIPYWQVNPKAAFSDAFAVKGAEWAKYVVSIGALSGMTTSLLGSMFALPRCVYAMAEDGLLFKTFAQINEKTQASISSRLLLENLHGTLKLNQLAVTEFAVTDLYTIRVPQNAVIVFGALTSIIALLFEIETLVQFLSIGTLLAYTIVSACVIVLRYRPIILDGNISQASGGRIKTWLPCQHWLNIPRPGSTVTWSVFVMIIGDFGISAAFATGLAHSTFGKFLIAFSVINVIFSFLLICLHDQNQAKLSFKVPLVPLIPALSMLVNIMLMLHLAPITWLRLILWLALGLTIYGTYGIKYSCEAQLETEGLPKSTTYESVVTDGG